MPKQGENILKFNNVYKQLPVPFVIYADFEAIMKKVQGCEQSEEMKKDKDRRSYTEAYQTHEETVAMDIRLYVAMMTNIVNTLASIEVKTLSTNLSKICLKRLSNVKLSLRSISTNHWL